MEDLGEKLEEIENNLGGRITAVRPDGTFVFRAVGDKEKYGPVRKAMMPFYRKSLPGFVRRAEGIPPKYVAKNSAIKNIIKAGHA